MKTSIPGQNINVEGLEFKTIRPKKSNMDQRNRKDRRSEDADPKEFISIIVINDIDKN